MTEAKAGISNHFSPMENPETISLLESEERFRLVLEASPDGFIILRSIRDAAGTIVDFIIEYANPVVARNVNHTQAALLGQHLLQLFPNYRASGIFDRYVAVAETGISETFETFYNNKNVPGWFRNVVVKLNDGIAISFSDITDYKQAELALKQQEQHFRVALQTAKLGSWEHDLTTGVLTCSAQCKANFGLPPDAEFTHETLFAALHPDDRSMVEAAIQRSIKEHTDYEVEERCYHPDGSLHWLIVQGQIIYDSQGTPIRLVGVTLDITERKQTEIALRESQELFQSFMNYSPIAAFIKDETGRYLYANSWVERVYQRPQSQLIGKTDFELLPPAIAEQFHANDVAALNSGQPIRMLETIHHEDGEHSYMSVKFPFCNAAGQQLVAGVAIDISERIQAEAALQQQEAELRLIANAVPVLISLVDAEQRYRFNNHRYEEWFGKSSTEMNGKYLWEVLGQTAYETIRPYVEQVLAGHEVMFESRIPYNEVGARDAVVNYVPRFDQQGNVAGFVALVSDITHRKQAEAERERLLQELAAERARFEAVLRQMPEGVIIADAASEEMILANERVNQILQHSFELNLELEDYDQKTPFHAYYSNGKMYASDEYPLVRSLRTGEFVSHEEMELRYADGHRIVIDANSSPIFDEQGQITSAIVLIQDITERKQIEQSLRASEMLHRTLSEAVPDFIWSCDENGQADFVNPRWTEYTGLTIEELNAGSLSQVNHPEDFPRLMEQWEAAQQTGEPFESEFRYRRKDGEYRWFMGRAVPLKDDEGKIVRWIGTSTDIHDRKQAEAEREQLLARERAARQEAEQANRIKDEFLAVLSHELRSPLNPILGWAKLLQMRQFDEIVTRRALETIERNAKLQTQLIEDLLDVSRILRGKMILNVCLVNLATVIDAALETVYLAAEAKDIKIHKVIASNAKAILGDPGRLQQIVWNLLSNAVKFTPNGGQIEIRLEQTDTKALIQVKDTGKGITPEFLPHVFEYFRQEDGSTVRKFGGLGLGLAIVRYLTEQHGGTVKAASSGEGKGATFTVLLPMTKDSNEENPDVAEVSSSIMSSLPLANLRILVVDNEADMRELIATILEQTGAQIKVLTSAMEALETLDSFNPDIVISDIGMPEMDGYELLRQIRSRSSEQGGNIPAIALTAYAGEINQQQALAAGFQQHIAKPVEPEELVQAIMNLVKLR